MIGKNTVYIVFGTLCGFWHPLGVLEHITCRYKGTTVLAFLK